jgi:hypothetical protein
LLTESTDVHVIMNTPALLCHHFEKHLAREQLLIPIVEDLADGPRALTSDRVEIDHDQQ